MERVIKLEGLAAKNEIRFGEHLAWHEHDKKCLEIMIQKMETDLKDDFEKGIKEKEEQIRKIEMVQKECARKDDLHDVERKVGLCVNQDFIRGFKNDIQK